jgi:phosphoribosylpyrophosphate synthetase
VPGWTPFVDWMSFPHLDGGGGFERAFTIAYKMTDEGGELWSTRFERFKSKNKEASVGGLYMMRTGIPPLLAALKLDPKQVVFVPALSSGETQASENGQMSVVARRCAEAAGAKFAQNALSKHVHNPIHGIFNAPGRDAELDKAAYVASKIHGKVVFVVDDFITRGSTLSRIAQAIQAANPDMPVYGVALGKTERKSFWPGLSNDHVDKKWDALWQKGEQLYREKSAGEKK